MIDTVSILIVEDEAMNQEMLSLMLTGLATTLVAENGREALDLLGSHPEIDLILLDLEMPVMDGSSTLSALKQHPVWRNIPVIVITASRDEVKQVLRQGANDFLAKPYDADELRLRAMNHVRAKKLFDISQDMNSFLEKEVARKTTALRDALEFAQDAEYEITLRLGRAAEFRDLETGMHIRRISEMAKNLGVVAGLSEADCQTLHYAAPLHDVGKVGIPDSILLKPGRLTDEEMDIMRLHTVIGGRILAEAQRFPSLEMGQVIALQHHEKWDGSGYPKGLSGKDIHIFGRIVTIVDIFDALCSKRPYKPALPFDQVLTIMREGKGIYFDPLLLDCFLQRIDDFVAIREALSDCQEEEEEPGQLQYIV